MGEFFRGWKRKIGVVTLVMACVFMVGWLRSLSRFEYIDITFGNVTYGVVSMHSGLDFFRTKELNPTIVWDFISFDSVELFIKTRDPENGTPWSPDFEFEWRWDWAGFHIGEGRYKNPNRRDQDCMIPYWFIVIPLTAIAAWLILSKPHTIIQKKIAEPITSEAT